jgi:hypothetical protein
MPFPFVPLDVITARRFKTKLYLYCSYVAYSVFTFDPLQSFDFFSKIEFDKYLKFRKNQFFSPLAKILPSWLSPL